ncbi:MAG: two-component regulator propeller domain-containing protein [Acidobacteriota bacterium]
MNSKSFIFALAILTSTVVGSIVDASAPRVARAKTSDAYRFDAWTADTGLPQNSVYSILQTRDGYLWFTTLDGLVRYDGVRFTVFNKGNSRGIESNRFNSLLEDREGNLWIGTEDGGLTRYKDGSFRTFTTQDNLPDNWILSLYNEPDGRLFINTEQGSVHCDGERMIAYSPRAGESASLALHIGDAGDLWYVDNSGLHRVSEGRATSYSIPGSDLSLAYLRMRRDRRGDVWVGGLSGKIYRIRDDQITVYAEGLPRAPVMWVCEDSRGAMWFATGAGLVRFKDERFTVYTIEHGLSSNNIRAVCEDREGTLWIGTGDRGLNRLTRQTIRVYSTRDGMTSDNVYPVFEDRAGRIWMGATELIRFEGGRFTSYSRKDGLPDLLVYSIFEDREGRLWVGATGSFCYFRDGKFTNFTARLGFAFNYGSAVYEDRRGRLWFGTDLGLAKFEGDTRAIYTTRDGLASNDIHVIHEDRNGDVWIGTYGGLSVFKDGRLASFTARDGLASDRVRCILEDRDGAMWIGTYDGGLSLFRDGRFTNYTTREGLFSNGVFQILEDRRGNFWMSSNQGIYRVSRRELLDFAEGKIRHITSVSYGKHDGLLNIECNGGRQPAGARSRDNRLWFPTQQGVAVIDPEAVEINQKPPPVVIEEILLDRDAIQHHAATIEVGPHKQNLEIHYTGLSFIKPDRVRFRYMLEGLDSEWVEAGTRRAAYYPHLPPGSYTFRVAAANSDGVWNETGASIRVVVHPPFWRTWWFTSIIALMSIALALAAYQWRVARLRQAKEAQEAFSRQLISSQEAERKRIAAELHDSLGQSLAIIKNLALLGLKSCEEASRDQLERIAEQSTQAIEEVKDISYNLRPYLLDRLGLKMALESMIKKVADASGVEFSIHIDDLEDRFTNEQEISLYRIVQESVNNTIKHACASRAAVEIHCDENAVEISVRDDGCGFAAEYVERAEKARRGFGLVGMAERAKLLGGILQIRSSPQQGTTITVRIPVRKEER